MESISKSRIQGVWDPAHSIRLPPLYTDDIRNYVPPPFHPDDIRNSAPLPFHLDVSHPEFRSRMGEEELLRIYISGSSNSAHPESFTAILHSTDSVHLENFATIFCTMPRCSPEASRYVRPTSLDIFL